jgi:hypothetical protein
MAQAHWLAYGTGITGPGLSRDRVRNLTDTHWFPLQAAYAAAALLHGEPWEQIEDAFEDGGSVGEFLWQWLTKAGINPDVIAPAGTPATPAVGLGESPDRVAARRARIDACGGADCTGCVWCTGEAPTPTPFAFTVALLHAIDDRDAAELRRARDTGAAFELDRMADECAGWSEAGTIGAEKRLAWVEATAMLRQRAAEIRGGGWVRLDTPGDGMAEAVDDRTIAAAVVARIADEIDEDAMYSGSQLIAHLTGLVNGIRIGAAGLPGMSPDPVTDADLTERLSGRVHDAWMQTKLSQGITSRPSADGEEQMVPYGQLSEPLKELDRSTVRAVLDALAKDVAR